MKKNTDNSLKNLAKQAKLRMKSEKFDSYSSQFYSARISEEDEKLYRKVCEILKENPNISNPIKKLCDEKVFKSLPEISKEKYVFDLVDKYLNFKDRFEKENKKVI